MTDVACAGCRRWPCACRRTVSESDLLALQGHAIVTNDLPLKYLCYEALGFSRVGFEPVTVGERRRAIGSCAARLESMRLTRTALREVAP